MPKTKSLSQHIQEVEDQNPYAHTFKILRTFRDKTNTMFELECLGCGNHWSTRVGHIKKGGRCRVCASKASAIAQQKSGFRYIMEIIERNPKARWLEFGELDRSGRKVRIRTTCLRCGKTWYARVRSLILGSGCRCQMSEEPSQGERLVEEALDALGIEAIPEKEFPDCHYERPLPFDFYLPDYDTLIEYQGIQHYETWSLDGYSKEELEKRQLRDQIKKDWAEENGYLLLRIPYTVDRLDLIVQGLIERLNL